jgi:hypothetical protein
VPETTIRADLNHPPTAVGGILDVEGAE